ncbi:MAG TPA: S-layer protein [Methanoregula sp.]|nr:S-layer protein [Methanoregula sp.]
MKFHNTIAILIVAAVFCCMPALCADRYSGGSPEISAYISGTNQFFPGEDATITVVLQNSATNTTKTLGQATLADDDISTTAKLVTVGLSAGNAPVVIKTDPQSLGDIRSSGRVTAQFSAKITNGATLGEYQLPLFVQYKYLDNNIRDQATSATIQYNYVQVNKTIPLTIKIKPEVRIDVLNVTASDITVGSEGYVNLTIKNIGNDNGRKATVTLIQSGSSAIIPTDKDVFIGNFPKDGVVSCLYKVSVTTDAQPQTYPVDVAVTYTNAEGDVVTSATETVGIPVSAKLNFTITSPPAEIEQGKTSVITVEYQNLGSITANDAEARLSTVDPFSSTDTMAFLGDIQPGGKSTVQYKISASSGADPAMYSLDTEVRYRDSLDNSQTSDTFKVPVNIVAQSRSGGIFSMYTILPIIVLVLIGAGYYVLVMRKKQ